jgi:regulation of enolase protein 1 (concanavalin A-like superfamily)
MPDLELASLKVAGKSVLKSGVNQYGFVRKASAKAPVVAATAKDASLRVVVEQAQAVPGTAVIKVIDDVTADSKTYLVNFGTKGVSDEFKSAPASAWTVKNENKKNYAVENGALVITTEAGDLTVSNNNAANVFLQSANSDWTVDTKLTCSAAPGMPSQNAGIIAHQDDDNFVKFVLGVQMGRRGPSGAGLMVLSEENGTSKATVNVRAQGVENNIVWLRLQKKGNVYTAFYSVDGKKYTEAGKVEANLKDIQAGLIACDGAMPAFGGFRAGAQAPAKAEPMKASFEMFKIVSSGL